MVFPKRGGGLQFVNGSQNRLNHTVHIEHHIIVPKPQNAIAKLNEGLVAYSIAVAISVLATVNLDDEAMLGT